MYTKFHRFLVATICCALSVFTIYTAAFGLFTALVQRGVHIALVLLAIFLLYPTSKTRPWLRIVDWLFLAGIAGTLVYLLSIYTTLDMRIGLTTFWDKFFGMILIVAVLEGCRRLVGWVLTGIALIFLAYAFFGYLIPGYFGITSYSLARVTTTMFLTTEGIFGPALSAAASFVAIFIVFGTFLERSGGSQIFIDLASSLAGHYRGGPAKVSVVASALTGSINGSAVANVTTTGVFTIPLMKRVGYRKPVAGAVEAVASSGGSILPPVMGAGAFVMSDMAGIPYATIALAAVIPALIYYLSLYFIVDFEAAKTNLGGLPRSELPALGATLKRSLVLFIPLGVLVYFLVFAKFSVMTSAFYAIVAVMLTSLVTPGHRIGLKTLYEICVLSAKRMLLVSVACAAAGVIVGVITLTGVGLKLSGLLLVMGANSMFLTLVVVMIGTVIIGMGLPPTPAYIVFAALSVPALLKLGLSPLTANMFVFFYSCFAPITPPVALAAYTAAGIADGPPMKTGWIAFVFALPALIVPFVFAYGPELLLEGTLMQIAATSLTAILAVIAFAGGVVGWMFKPLNAVTRLWLYACGFALIIPVLWMSGLGLLGFALVGVWLWLRARQQGGSPLAGAGGPAQ